MWIMQEDWEQKKQHKKAAYQKFLTRDFLYPIEDRGSRKKVIFLVPPPLSAGIWGRTWRYVWGYFFCVAEVFFHRKQKSEKEINKMMGFKSSYSVCGNMTLLGWKNMKVCGVFFNSELFLWFKSLLNKKAFDLSSDGIFFFIIYFRFCLGRGRGLDGFNVPSLFWFSKS